VHDGVAIVPTTANVQVLEVSLGGVLLQSDQMLEVGSDGSLSLTLDGSRFRANVHVQRVAATGSDEGWHLGARFVDLSPDDRQLITRFMAP
jgi:hypothetical protein